MHTTQNGRLAANKSPAQNTVTKQPDCTAERYLDGGFDFYAMVCGMIAAGFSSPTDMAQQAERRFSASAFLLTTCCAWHGFTFKAGRVGHLQRCAGSISRSANPHGLPRSFSSDGAGLQPVDMEPNMANTTTTPSTGTTASTSTTSAGLEQATEDYRLKLKAAQELLRESTNYVLDGFEESQEQHLALISAILRDLEPQDPKNPPDEHPTMAWRLAQVLYDSLSATHDLQIARQFLLGEVSRA